MRHRSYINQKANKTKEDIEFGKLQETCDGINLMNILFVVVGSILLYNCVNYYNEGLRRSDEMGHIVTMLGIIGCIGMVLYGIYCLTIRRIHFFEYGLVYKSYRIAYDDIESIASKRVVSGVRNLFSVSTYYIIKRKQEDTVKTLNSGDFRGLDTIMSNFLDQVDVYIGKLN